MLLNILLGILIVVGVSMTGVILLQRSEGGGIVSGGTGNLMTARGAGNLLTRTTQILAGMFFLLSLLITILTGREAGGSALTNQIKLKGIDPSVLQQKMAPPQPTAPVSTPGGPALPGAPVGLPTSSFPTLPK